MPDDARGGEPETEAQRRDRILNQVRVWCDTAHIEGRPLAELSDDAAVLIAAAYLDEPTQQILANRRRTHRSIPSIGGFAGLRRLADERRRLEEKAAAQRGGAVQTVYNLRATDAAKRLQGLRNVIVTSSVHYANTLRTIRRDRRAGIHLDPLQRERLFEALQYTPTPLQLTPIDQVRRVAFGAAAGSIAKLSENFRIGERGKRVADSLAGPATTENGKFADRYDTLLYLAGALFDRVEGSSVWQSDHFAVQRSQLDLADELIQIAVDTVALRDIDFELEAVLSGILLESARNQVESRKAALVPVWDQLVVRVAALARIGDLLSKAESQLRSVAAVQQTISLDARIDDLIARSGNRELSAANTHFVGDQFDGVDQLLMSYQALLYDDILALTARGATGT
ncbi:hypothetical protein [Antrihabitans sp. YC2-6]|uniref:hypothetical protein n=1 Tax=Antrihabitans sp. YC2-6 TaxID=2799498 RepID=UPI0018F3C639|nr:hypothetical protein [Antrihabitans sp. YC2-6]MBJ8343486.1 hypothetical protein [Antrihabitans sp. YC2-6]